LPVASTSNPGFFNRLVVVRRLVGVCVGVGVLAGVLLGVGVLVGGVDVPAGAGVVVGVVVGVAMVVIALGVFVGRCSGCALHTTGTAHVGKALPCHRNKFPIVACGMQRQL